ncbi:hypothetical protein [Roseomonas rosulenta]|uniref:hypothetical protein n=1 Tax=Roseomonas rosulenta TaxID=2748667 RepID=UPI0018E0059C|nr:hypothetical protein [Roseomonas rosulenta]
MSKAHEAQVDPAIKPDDLLKAREISKESLRKLIAIAEHGEMRLVNWERFGQPPIIDRVVATLEGPVKMAGQVVDGIYATAGLRARIRDIFPKGIPRPDILRIEVEVGPGFG